MKILIKHRKLRKDKDETLPLISALVFPRFGKAENLDYLADCLQFRSETSLRAVQREVFLNSAWV